MFNHRILQVRLIALSDFESIHIYLQPNNSSKWILVRKRMIEIGCIHTRKRNEKKMHAYVSIRTDEHTWSRLIVSLKVVTCSLNVWMSIESGGDGIATVELSYPFSHKVNDRRILRNPTTCNEYECLLELVRARIRVIWNGQGIVCRTVWRRVASYRVARSKL